MTESVVEQYGHAGCVVKIIYDEDPINPREDYDHESVMFCDHRRYTLGDKDHGIDTSECGSWSDVHNLLVAEHKARVILPLYLMDHSGISMSTADFHDQWDSGMVGFIFMTAAQIREQYLRKRVTKDLETRAREGLKAEVEEYDAYLTGDCYGYVVERDDEEVASCWGYLGDEQIPYMKTEANAIAEREQAGHADYVGRL